MREALRLIAQRPAGADNEGLCVPYGERGSDQQSALNGSPDRLFLCAEVKPLPCCCL